MENDLERLENSRFLSLIFNKKKKERKKRFFFYFDWITVIFININFFFFKQINQSSSLCMCMSMLPTEMSSIIINFNDEINQKNLVIIQHYSIRFEPHIIDELHACMHAWCDDKTDLLKSWKIIHYICHFSLSLSFECFQINPESNSINHFEGEKSV